MGTDVWIVHRTVGTRCGVEVFENEAVAHEWANTKTGVDIHVGVQRRTVHTTTITADLATREPVTQIVEQPEQVEGQLQIGDVA